MRHGDLVIGRVVGVFGVRGEVKVAPAEPAVFVAGLEVHLRSASATSDPRPLQIKSVRFHKRLALVRFEDIADAAAAMVLQGAEIFCSRRDLPKLQANEYRAADLVGMKVIDAHLGVLGEVSEVRHYPASDMLVLAQGKRLVPLLKAYAAKVDIGSGEIYLTLPDGFAELI